jgi:hypothetical protein
VGVDELKIVERRDNVLAVGPHKDGAPFRPVAQSHDDGQQFHVVVNWHV